MKLSPITYDIKSILLEKRDKTPVLNVALAGAEQNIPVKIFSDEKSILFIYNRKLSKEFVLSLVSRTKTILLVSICSICISIVARAVGSDVPPISPLVTMVKTDTYWSISINDNTLARATEVGIHYANLVKLNIPNYSELYDSFLNDIFSGSPCHMQVTTISLATAISHAHDVLQQLDPTHRAQLEALAQGLATSSVNLLGDHQLSADEILLINLVPEAVRNTGCSVGAAWGSFSKTGHNIIGRNLDWPGGCTNQLGSIHAITKFNASESTKGFYSVGYVMYLGVLTGINDSRIFLANLDSDSNYSYSSSGKRSFTFDYRKALETFESREQVVRFLAAPDKLYPYNSIVAIGDSEKTEFLENNTYEGLRRIRTSTSALSSSLNPVYKYNWSGPNATQSIATVNAYLLPEHNIVGNPGPGLPSNFQRWNSFVDLFQQYSNIGLQEMQSIMSFQVDGSTLDQSNLTAKASLMTIFTQQSIVIEPATLTLKYYTSQPNINVFTFVMPSTPKYVSVPLIF